MNRFHPILIILLTIVVAILAMEVPDEITALKPFFTMEEKIAIIIFTILFVLFPMLFRILNEIMSLKHNIRRHEECKNICPLTGEAYCCIDVYYTSKLSASKQEVFSIAQSESLEEYKLMLENVLNDIERDFDVAYSSHREVWIYSYNLDTEVLDDSSQDIATKNVNKGLPYVYFHTSNIINRCEHDAVERNKGKLLSKINDDKKELNYFIPLDENKEEGIDIFTRIIGLIMFVELIDGNPETSSYFPLRSTSTEPSKNNLIYFKLPHCMNREYYEHFKRRKEHNEEQQSTNSQVREK